jgi:hypothetical protein
MDKTHILIVVMLLLIIVLLILNFKKQNQINAMYSSIMVGSSENFDASKIGEKKVKLCLYYTEWCGYSQKFLPVWDEFRKYVEDNKLNIVLEKVDCDKEKEKCQNIPGFPTIVLEKEGDKPIEMNGKYPRTVDGLLSFLSDSL